MILLKNINERDLLNDLKFSIIDDLKNKMVEKEIINEIIKELNDIIFWEKEINNWAVNLKWDLNEDLDNFIIEKEFNILWENFKQETLKDILIRLIEKTI